MPRYNVRTSRQKYRMRRLRRRRNLYKAKKLARGNGYLKMIRKLPIITASNLLGIAGNLQATDPTGTCLALGTPVAKTGYTQIYDVPFSMKFSLDQVVNYVELTAIADMYKLKNVMVRLECPFNVAQAPGGTATPLPYIEYIQDHDDDGVPNVASFRERMGLTTKYFSSSKPKITMGVNPKTTTLLYQSGIANGYSVSKQVFINATSPAVPHYGIKGVLRNVWIPAVANGSPFTFDISTKFVLKDIQ